MNVWTVEESIEGEGVYTLAITESEAAATEFRRRLLAKRRAVDSETVSVEEVEVLTLAQIVAMGENDFQ